MKDSNPMNNRICYIVGAGVLEETSFDFINKGILIAADGGFKALEAAGIDPDYIVGDFDSLEEIPEGFPTEVYTSEKDETDMMIAVNKGLDLGYNVFVIYGGLGGRLEHSIANIQMLSYLKRKESQGYLIQGEKIITVVHDESYKIKAQDTGYLSVFSLKERAQGVTLKGLKYGLNNGQLTNDFPVGVSNEFIGKDVSIEVKSGTLMIMWQAKNPAQSLFTEPV
jgi:thiamine pyrophosphokinase